MPCEWALRLPFLVRLSPASGAGRASARGRVARKRREVPDVGGAAIGRTAAHLERRRAGRRDRHGARRERALEPHRRSDESEREQYDQTSHSDLVRELACFNNKLLLFLAKPYKKKYFYH
jgi:hypothetical protein